MHVLEAVKLAAGCSTISLIAHLIFSSFRKSRKDDEPRIFGLLRQLRLICAVWVFAFLAYTLLFIRLEAEAVLPARAGNYMSVAGFSYGIFLYLLLSFVYLTLYYLVDRSVSATLLEIIDNSPGQKLTALQIKQAYDTDKKYQNELKGMLDGHFILKEEDYYYNSFKGSMYARMVRMMKRALSLGPGG